MVKSFHMNKSSKFTSVMTSPQTPFAQFCTKSFQLTTTTPYWNELGPSKVQLSQESILINTLYIEMQHFLINSEYCSNKGYPIDQCLLKESKLLFKYWFQTITKIILIITYIKSSFKTSLYLSSRPLSSHYSNNGMHIYPILSRVTRSFSAPNYIKHDNEGMGMGLSQFVL